VAAPPHQRPVQQDPKDLREIQARRAKTKIATGIRTVTEITTEMQAGQASLRHAQPGSILTRITTAERLASETDDLERSRSQLE
jgi:hypothetical protein